MAERMADVVIVGGGMGGCAAALAATARGLCVVMTEQTAWIGGQLTSQAVPPDENRWIETHGGTARYQAFREGVRRYYRDHYPLRPVSRCDARLNPGAGQVSRLCHEPRVALAVIEQMLAWARSAGRLEVMPHCVPVSADTDGDRVRSVTVRDQRHGRETTLVGRYILDATELGDLLALADVEHVTGAESQSQTGEPHAPTGDPRPDNVQAFTWCFAAAWDRRPGANHTIDKPEQYDRWREYTFPVDPSWPGPVLSWTDVDPQTLTSRQTCLLPGEGKSCSHPRWLYRRIVTGEHYPPEIAPDEVTLVNWPQNDYVEGNLIGASPAEVERYHREAKQQSLSLMYWLQTEAPRHDGGAGYPELYLRPDLMGTSDGLAMAPYIRESRRIRAVFTVLEQHVGTEARTGKTHLTSEDARAFGDVRAVEFHDTVGIGHYRIDLHMSTGGNNYVDISSLPFQIPLGALLPVRVENLLPACKNLGVTHITNGCYRLHPVEWNIGESVGLLTAFCLERDVPPRAVRESNELLADFQKMLAEEGVQLAWPRCYPV
jgi:hypothetical protein